MPTIPSFISARELSKVIKRPLKQVLQQAGCTKRKNHYHLEFDQRRYRFQKPGHVVLPFDVVADRVSDVDVERLDTVPAYHVTGSSVRSPIVAVMGHVNHGKTTLLDGIRGSAVAKSEAHGITQTVNVGEYRHIVDDDDQKTTTTTTTLTFLDTPGHFHFHRMRNTASALANAIVLLVAANEGVRAQTVESIGCIDDAMKESRVPPHIIVCVNKMDLAPDRLSVVTEEIREYVSLDKCSVVPIVAKDPSSLNPVVEELLTHAPSIDCLDYDNGGQGVLLEVRSTKGRGNLFRVLGLHGTIQVGDHFVCGLTHGRIRQILDVQGGKNSTGIRPGRVADVMFASVAKETVVDAPIETDFYAVRPAEADVVARMAREKADAVDFADAWLEDEEERHDDNDDTVVRREPQDVLLKADSAGSIACVQDSVDDLPGVRVVHIGIGDVTETDLKRAGDDCIIVGFNVCLDQRLAQQFATNRVVLLHTVHEVVEAIEGYGAPSCATTKPYRSERGIVGKNDSYL